MRIRFVAATALLLFLVGVPSVVSSASTKPTVSAIAAKTQLPATGGKVTLNVNVRSASLCIFSSTPKVAGFNGTVHCSTGKLTRSGMLSANKGAKRSVQLKVVVTQQTLSAAALVVIKQLAHAAPKAYLDPTFSQDPSNPLKVTWCASVNDASATSPCQVNNGTNPPASLTRDPSLAPGVLNFYIGPVGATLGLVCSVNVSPTVNYAQCTSTLTAVGSYTVNTQYLAGNVNATATETSVIPAYSTTTTVSVQSPVTLSKSACTPTHFCSTQVTFSTKTQNGNPMTSGTFYLSNAAGFLGYVYPFSRYPSGTCVINWFFDSVGALYSDGASSCLGFNMTNPGSGFSVPITASFTAQNGYAASQSATTTMVVNVVP